MEQHAESIFESLAACDVGVVALVVKPFAWHESSVPAWQQALVRRLSKEQPTVVAALGINELLSDYPEAAVQVVTYSDVPVCQRALVELLFGVPNE